MAQSPLGAGFVTWVHSQASGLLQLPIFTAPHSFAHVEE